MAIFIEPAEILFIHGPKSSGKTTLLYKFLEQTRQKQKINIKFLNLRKTFTNVSEDFLKTFFRVETQGKKKESLASNVSIGFFSILTRRWLYPKATPDTTEFKD